MTPKRQFLIIQIFKSYLNITRLALFIAQAQRQILKITTVVTNKTKRPTNSKISIIPLDPLTQFITPQSMSVVIDVVIFLNTSIYVHVLNYVEALV